MKTSNLLKYMLGGHAEFHIEIKGIQSDYIINKKNDAWFINASEGKQNDWRYLGCISSFCILYFTRSEFEPTTPVRSSFDFVWRFARDKKDIIDSRLKIWNNGICSVCGRQLKTEESCNIGIGPECLKKI